MKKIWFPNTRTKKCCSGAFKDVPRYLDYVGVSRWIGCRNFCGNTGKCLKWTPYVSISSLVDTDQLSERHKKRAPFSTTETCYSLFYPCYDIFIRQKMSQYERTLFHSRRQPHDQTAADALSELACDSHTLKCLRTLMSFSSFSHNTAGNVWRSRLSGSDQWGEGHTLHVPLLHIHLHPSACHCSLTRQHELTDISSQIHFLWTQHILA